MRRSMTLSAVLSLSIVSLALAQGPVGIYSTVSGHSTNNVPGLNIPFDTTNVAFDRPFRSPDGSRWILTALTSDASTTIDEVIITGSGLTGALSLQEGISNVEPGRACEGASIDTRVSINNAGNFSFTCNLAGATTDDEVIGKSIGGVLSVGAREGQSVGGLIAGATLSTILDTPGIDNANKISFRSTLTGPPAGQTTAVFLGDLGSVGGQYGVTNAGNGSTWQTITAGDPTYSGDGSTWFTHGDTNDPVTTQDYIVSRNNTQLMREGTSPGGGLPGWNTISEAFMFPNNDWMARGAITAAPDEDWVVFNGSLVSSGLDLVPGGLPGERFDDATFAALYFSMTANNLGQYMYGGVTDNADLTRNAVMVWSDGITSLVVLREGDAVDLDNNGLLDDNAFISVFNNDDGFLTDNNFFYFTAELRNAAGTTIGQAFMNMQVPEPATFALIAIGGLMLTRRTRRN